MSRDPLAAAQARLSLLEEKYDNLRHQIVCLETQQHGVSREIGDLKSFLAVAPQFLAKTTEEAPPNLEKNAGGWWRIPDAKRAEILRIATSGDLTSAQVAAKTGVSYGTVRRIVRGAGLGGERRSAPGGGRKRGRFRTAEQMRDLEERVGALLDGDLTRKEISTTLGVPLSTIGYVVRSIRLRKKAAARAAGETRLTLNGETIPI